MGNDLKGIENYFELTGGSSYRGFELPGADYTFTETAIKTKLFGSLIDQCTIKSPKFESIENFQVV